MRLKVNISPSLARRTLCALLVFSASIIAIWSHIRFDDTVGYCYSGIVLILAMLLFKGVKWANVSTQYLLVFLSAVFPLAALNPEVAVPKMARGYSLWQQILVLALYEMVFFGLIFLLKISRSTGIDGSRKDN